MLFWLKLWSILPITLLRLLYEGVINEVLGPAGHPKSSPAPGAPGVPNVPRIFGAGQNFSIAAVTGLAGPFAVISAAICAGSGKQARVTVPTVSRWPSYSMKKK